jgi:hypothetical protein
MANGARFTDYRFFFYDRRTALRILTPKSFHDLRRLAQLSSFPWHPIPSLDRRLLTQSQSPELGSSFYALLHLFIVLRRPRLQLHDIGGCVVALADLLRYLTAGSHKPWLTFGNNGRGMWMWDIFSFNMIARNCPDWIAHGCGRRSILPEHVSTPPSTCALATSSRLL